MAAINRVWARLIVFEKFVSGAGLCRLRMPSESGWGLLLFVPGLVLRYYVIAMPTPPRNADEELLIGLRRIGDFMGVSERTVRRWRDWHGFPCGPLPSGHIVASKVAIRNWIAVRGRMALDQRRNECPFIMTGVRDHGSAAPAA